MLFTIVSISASRLLEDSFEGGLLECVRADKLLFLIGEVCLSHLQNWA